VTTTLEAPGRGAGLLRSTVGRKQLMAVTGVLWFLFVFLHMVGNLKFFFGPATFDHYSHWLRTLFTPLLPHGWYLWLQRGGLTVALLLHMWAATSLTLQSRKARPVRYAKTANVQATYASRTMRWGGVIILLFIVYHVLDLSMGPANPGFVRGEVFRNTVASLEQWPVAAVYILAVGAVSMHVFHGVWSALQTLGANRPNYDLLFRRVSQMVALLIFAGFASLPIAILAGYRG
jgi:succinate dehydrogenase / fumarate reductase, cytochrome b subunit